jgi:hypothetical protein
MAVWISPSITWVEKPEGRPRVSTRILAADHHLDHGVGGLVVAGAAAGQHGVAVADQPGRLGGHDGHLDLLHPGVVVGRDDHRQVLAGAELVGQAVAGDGVDQLLLDGAAADVAGRERGVGDQQQAIHLGAGGEGQRRLQELTVESSVRHAASIDAPGGGVKTAADVGPARLDTPALGV